MNQDLQTFATALGLGLLVGLQRQHGGGALAGIRTFPLITLLGAVCADLSQWHGGWTIGAGLVSVAAMLLAARWLRPEPNESGAGATTIMAALVMYGIGAYLRMGDASVAVALAGVVVVLLHAKEPLHAFVERMGPHDIRAVIQFVVIAGIILPILPDVSFGPYQVWNPRDIWRMVVLIVGLSLMGYGAYKWFGGKTGAVLGGVLGGLIASTATAASQASRTGSNPAMAAAASLVIALSSAVALARVTVEIAVVAPTHFAAMAGPVVCLVVTLAALAAAQYPGIRHETVEQGERENPAELKSAIFFGVVYALVLAGVAVARDYFGEGGLMVVAVFSGLTDMDAITLSTSRLVEQGVLDPREGWRVVVVATMANMGFKIGISAALGGWALGRRVALTMGIAMGVAVLLIALWGR